MCVNCTYEEKTRGWDLPAHPSILGLGRRPLAMRAHGHPPSPAVAHGMVVGKQAGTMVCCGVAYLPRNSYGNPVSRLQSHLLRGLT